MILKFMNWQKVLLYNDEFNHLPLYRFAWKLEMTPTHFNLLVKELGDRGLIYLRAYDQRSKRIKLTEKGRVVEECLQRIKAQISSIS